MSSPPCELRYQTHPDGLADVVAQGAVHLEMTDERSAFLAVATPHGDLFVTISAEGGRLHMRDLSRPSGCVVTVDGKAVE